MALARPRTWGMVGLSVLVGITTLAGFIFFIFPGIILSIWFSQAEYIYAINGIGGTKAMGLSREYVRGRWWKTFGYLLIPSLAVYACTPPLNYIANFANSQIALAVSALVLLSVNVAGSLFILCYGYHLYRALKATSSISAVASNDG